MTDSSADEFEQKAARLMQKLHNFSNLPALSHPSNQQTFTKPLNNHLSQLQETIETSDQNSKTKNKQLQEELRKFENVLRAENQSKVKIHNNLMDSMGRMQKNTKCVLSEVRKGFEDKEKKMVEKIEAIVKGDKKELESKLHLNVSVLINQEDLMDQMKRVDSKINTIIAEVLDLKKARTELETRINRQFLDQIRELKLIFDRNLKEREHRESQNIQHLKQIYKQAMESLAVEESQRFENEKMLLAVVEQLINRIMQA